MFMLTKQFCLIKILIKAMLAILVVYVLIMWVMIFSPLRLFTNDDYASRQQIMKYCEGYVSYYTQEMWDGTIQTVISTSGEGANSIEAVNGEFATDVGKIIAIDFRQPKQEYGRGLISDQEKIRFCGANGCKTIANCSGETLALTRQ